MPHPSENLASKARALGLRFSGIQAGAGNVPDQFLFTKRNPGSPLDGHTLCLSVDFAQPEQLEQVHNNALRAAVRHLPAFEAMPETLEA